MAQLFLEIGLMLANICRYKCIYKAKVKLICECLYIQKYIQIFIKLSKCLYPASKQSYYCICPAPSVVVVLFGCWPFQQKYPANLLIKQSETASIPPLVPKASNTFSGIPNCFILVAKNFSISTENICGALRQYQYKNLLKTEN